MTEITESNNSSSVSWPAVGRGALAGLAIVIVAAVTRAVLNNQIDHFNKSGWVYPLFILVLVGYFVAGLIAGRAYPSSPLTVGGLAGLGTVVLWIPIRIVVWALREDGRSLVSGNEAALRPGQLFGALVISTAVGMLGGLIATRRARAKTLNQ